MIEKSLYVIIFMYIASFGFLGAQYVFADIFGVQIKNFDGVPLEDEILDISDFAAFNTALVNITSTNFTLADTADAFIAAGEIAALLFLILTGTYIFNLLFLFGVPAIFVAGFVGVYVIFVARSMLAYIRGV